MANQKIVVNIPMMRPKITTPAVSVFVREMSPAILVVYADGVLLSLCCIAPAKKCETET